MTQRPITWVSRRSLQMPQERLTIFARVVAVLVMLLAVTTLAAVALHGWRMHLLALRSQYSATAALADLGADQLEAKLDRRPKGVSVQDALNEAFSDWVGAVLRQPRVLAAGILDSNGTILQSSPPGALLRAEWAEGPILDGSMPRSIDIFGQGRLRVWLVSLPIGDGYLSAPAATLLLVAEAAPPEEAWLRWSGVFGLPLTAVAAFCFVVSLRWLNSTVHKPLAELLRRRHEGHTQWAERLPMDRGDELGAIARDAGALVSELGTLQRELSRMQTSVNSRLEQHTRAISAQLRDERRKGCIDALTLLGNRRSLDEHIEQVFESGRSSGDDLAAVMLDVDNFKEHNDQAGHAAGDELLRFLGRLLRASMRESDLAFRYAGDEFVLLLPTTDAEQAAILVRRIVRLFSQHTSTLPTQPRPTLSAGVASTRRSRASSGRGLLGAADAALYGAKGAGKDQVGVA